MCGIFFSLSCGSPSNLDERTSDLLRRRGPDSYKEHRTEVKRKYTSGQNPALVDERQLHLSFTSTVLALRGESVTSQPLIDGATGSVLCWNGEAWKFGTVTVAGNDSDFVFGSLLQAASSRWKDLTVANGTGLTYHNEAVRVGVAAVMSKISGPFAFLFYDGNTQQLFFGRDHLGRRSLLQRDNGPGGLMIASVCGGCRENEWKEVEADGIYVVSLDEKTAFDSHAGSGCAENELAGPLFPTRNKIPWRAENIDPLSATGMEPSIPALNRTLPSTDIPSLSVNHPSLRLLQRHLSESLTLRVAGLPSPPDPVTLTTTDKRTKLAILFSGGLDCTVLARLVHDVLPASEDIDLLNVAFENPRVVSAFRNKGESSAASGAASASTLEAQAGSSSGVINTVIPYDMCPDRITGRASFGELAQVCPGRIWRFVEVNVPYWETQQHRSSVISLIHPHSTEMDLSIAFAFYFAARGSGVVYDPTASIYSIYKSPARVLLSGLGADELFAGYNRHATAYSRRGFPGLLDELELDITRLGKRNLGRDDRVMSNWGKEVRFPYLDEDLLGWTLRCPVWEKCGFGQEEGIIADEDEPRLEPGKKLLRLEPGKKLLRLLAYKLGMKAVAREKKRAIQFGARTAKMESGKSKGTHLISHDRVRTSS